MFLKLRCCMSLFKLVHLPIIKNLYCGDTQFFFFFCLFDNLIVGDKWIWFIYRKSKLINIYIYMVRIKLPNVIWIILYYLIIFYLNWYFKNPTVEIYVLYILNAHIKFTRANRILFAIRSINSSLMYNFKIWKLEF